MRPVNLTDREIKDVVAALDCEIPARKEANRLRVDGSKIEEGGIEASVPGMERARKKLLAALAGKDSEPVVPLSEVMEALLGEKAVQAAYLALDGEQLKWLASAPPARKVFALAALNAAFDAVFPSTDSEGESREKEPRRADTTPNVSDKAPQPEQCGGSGEGRQ